MGAPLPCDGLFITTFTSVLSQICLGHFHAVTFTAWLAQASPRWARWHGLVELGTIGCSGSHFKQSWAPSSCQNCHGAVGQHCVPSLQPCVQHWIGCKILMGPFLHGCYSRRHHVMESLSYLSNVWLTRGLQTPEKPTEVAEKSLSQRERARGQGPAR